MRAFNLFSAKRICSELGERIKRLRLAQNLSQQQLADMTLASLSSVRRLEAQGQGGLEFVVRVAQALQVTTQLEPLFELATTRSIAQIEQDAALNKRQRASNARVKKASA
jgi:transcriptional regulator with XRE-family HTH domain